MTTDPNAPAYPQLFREYGQLGWQEMAKGGLTKREIFAMHAMQGMLANPGGHELTTDDLIDHSILCANMLIKKLSDTKQS